MSAITVTNTFQNGAGNVVDATLINQNYTDITNGLANGTSDITVGPVVCTSIKPAGAEAVKIKTYTYVLQAADIAGSSCNITISVVLAKVRSAIVCGIDVTTGYVESSQAPSVGANLGTRVQITSVTNAKVYIGSDWAAGDTLSLTIIEAV